MSPGVLKTGSRPPLPASSGQTPPSSELSPCLCQPQKVGFLQADWWFQVFLTLLCPPHTSMQRN